MKLYYYLLSAAVLASCTKLPKDSDILDGPVQGLSGEESQRFLKGDAAFNNEVFTTANGLGPLFVATSCGSCHAGDGKGHPFTALTRFGQSDATGNLFISKGAPQLQHRAIPGYNAEQLPAGATFSKFMPPANTGLGFIELVSDADILAMADPNDIDGDGISGVPNWNTVPAYAQTTGNNISQDGKYICRFGKKASVFNLLQQTANAYNQDIGITSIYEPYDTYTKQEIDPEISTQTVLDVVHYLQTLKAPVARDQDNETVKSGRQLFLDAGCGNCHRETLKTGASPIQALAYKEFHPYTDLLLHDMGTGLDDGYTEGTAQTYEWRTPALWGLGLSPNSQGGQYFLLHDGRAHTLNEAIQLHGGEAASSRQRYSQLSEGDKQRLIRFLESL
jgi:CxxC motif-containing protein (DUF1111 family)